MAKNGAHKLTDPWVKCKTINGPDPSKKSSWCASLHQQANGKFWCGMKFFGDSCPFKEKKSDRFQAQD